MCMHVCIYKYHYVRMFMYIYIYSHMILFRIRHLQWYRCNSDIDIVNTKNKSPLTSSALVRMASNSFAAVVSIQPLAPGGSEFHGGLNEFGWCLEQLFCMMILNSSNWCSMIFWEEFWMKFQEEWFCMTVALKTCSKELDDGILIVHDTWDDGFNTTSQRC